MTTSPRVLLLADHMGYDGGVVHGVTTYYLTVLPRLRQQGIDVRCCFLSREHPAAEPLRSAGVPVDFLGVARWNPFVIGRATQVARAMGAQVLHVVNMKAAIAGRAVARRLGIPVLIHSHDMYMAPLGVRMLYRLLRIEHERGLAVSAAAAACMSRAYGIRASHVGVLYNGVDTSAFHLPRTGGVPPGLPESSPLILWIGRLHSIKGPDRMIRLMKGIARQVPGAHLAMIGDGPERGACEALIQDLQLGDRITLLGQRSDVPRILAHATVLCMTSLNEGAPLVAVEAAAAGVPVVAYAVGGVGEMIDPDNTGLLVADGDEAGFVRTLVALLGDADRRQSMAMRSRQFAENFSMGRHLHALVDAYQELRAEYGT